MSVRAILAVAALALAVGRAAADAIVDASVVRSIEQTANGTRLSLDVNRTTVESYLRGEFAGQVPGMQVRSIALGGAAGSSVFDVSVQFVIERQVGPAVLRASGTVTGRLVVSVAADNVVEGQVLLDSIALGGPPTELHGIPVGTGMRRLDLSGVDGAIQHIAIDSIDASWIALSIDVK